MHDHVHVCNKYTQFEHNLTQIYPDMLDTPVTLRLGQSYEQAHRRHNQGKLTLLTLSMRKCQRASFCYGRLDGLIAGKCLHWMSAQHYIGDDVFYVRRKKKKKRKKMKRGDNLMKQKNNMPNNEL